MRKIRIDDDIRAVAAEYKVLLDKHKTNIISEIDNLRSKFDGGHTIIIYGGKQLDHLNVKARFDYVDKFRTDYDSDRFVLMLPNAFEEVYLNEYSHVLNDKELCKKLSIDGDSFSSLSDRLVKAMGYTDYVRGEIFPTIIRKLGIKACVYCNSNYAVAGGDGGNYFELDHWKPKSKYPFLSTSFYNLQPCCSHCNRRKSSDNNKYDFLKLYEEDPNESLDIFQFHIPESALVMYFSAQDISRMKIDFKASKPEFEKLKDDANKKFSIEGIYNLHIDVIEEMMWRAKFYNNVILGTMTWLYGKRWPMVDLDRFKLGTYSKKEEIHKRPLTKFMQDIGEQLEIIQEKTVP